MKGINDNTGNTRNEVKIMIENYISEGYTKNQAISIVQAIALWEIEDTIGKFHTDFNNQMESFHSTIDDLSSKHNKKSNRKKA